MNTPAPTPAPPAPAPGPGALGHLAALLVGVAAGYVTSKLHLVLDAEAQAELAGAIAASFTTGAHVLGRLGRKLLARWGVSP